MPSFTNVDIKLSQRFSAPLSNASSLLIYLDIRNLFDQQNVLWVDSNGRIGGELGDPGGYALGRRTSLGLQIEL
jgi:outer membrane receptor protein involved in Fe transport